MPNVPPSLPNNPPADLRSPLAKLFEGQMLLKESLEKVIAFMNDLPLLSATLDKMDADLDDIEREIVKLENAKAQKTRASGRNNS
jgi:hypothetical protein